jgi:hypothetical protein
LGVTASRELAIVPAIPAPVLPAAALDRLDLSGSPLGPRGATALTTLAVEVALRRWRARDEANGAPAEDAEEELARFAGFPNLWSLGEP